MALGNRLTRVEVQMQERGETIRSMATDTSRRMQQLEGDVGRIETLLEVVRDELTAIRASQSEIKLLVTQQSGPTQALGRGNSRSFRQRKKIIINERWDIVFKKVEIVSYQVQDFRYF